MGDTTQTVAATTENSAAVDALADAVLARIAAKQGAPVGALTGATQAAETVVSDAEQVVEKTPILEALKAKIADSPELRFVDHLKALAEDGYGAVIDNQALEPVFHVLVPIVEGLVKGL